jgi:hypothetical protein
MRPNLARYKRKTIEHYCGDSTGHDRKRHSSCNIWVYQIRIATGCAASSYHYAASFGCDAPDRYYPVLHSPESQNEQTFYRSVYGAWATEPTIQHRTTHQLNSSYRNNAMAPPILETCTPKTVLESRSITLAPEVSATFAS